MKRALFGTDGVRGLAGQYPLDDEGAERIGRAIGVHFAEAGQSMVIGWDPRESSAPIVQAVAAGLCATGVNVVRAGVIATPGLAYLTREHDEFVAGIMITASHNPYQYNGIKVFAANGGKLSDEIEATINQLIESDIAERESAGMVTTDDTLRQQYEDFLVASVGEFHLPDTRIAIDSAHGATSEYAATVLGCLGAQVTPLGNAPDGRNINDACGATDVTALQQVVREQGLAVGVALDGDADRVIMVDERGREVKGDYLMYILAVANHFEGVVATVMSNMGFEQALQSKGIALKRTAVGDRYVLEGLEATGWKLGGEQSGHIILPDILATGDGLLAALQVLKVVQDSGKSLSDWCDEVTPLPQALVNIKLLDRSLLEAPAVQAYVQTQEAQFAGAGRLLIRPSGTEPLARVMVEAPDAQAVAERIAQELEQLLAAQAAKEVA